MENSDWHVFFLGGKFQEEDFNATNTPLAILTFANEDVHGAYSPVPLSAAVIIEDEIVLKDIPSLPEAFVLLFGLVYVLNLGQSTAKHVCFDRQIVM